MLCHQALANCLRSHRANVMFGLMGDGNLWVVDSVCRKKRQ